MAIRIALVGKPKAGRTFVADYLRITYKFKKESIGDGVARILRILYYYEDHARIRWEDRLRFYDALYKIDPNVWVGYLERKLRTTTRNVVIDDIRYLNELEVLKNLGFVIVRIVSPENIRNKKISAVIKGSAKGLLDLHETFNKDFTEEAKVDYSVYNETKEGTRLAIDEIVRLLQEKLDLQA